VEHLAAVLWLVVPALGMEARDDLDHWCTLSRLGGVCPPQDDHAMRRKKSVC
jgi:hypothetical protein